MGTLRGQRGFIRPAGRKVRAGYRELPDPLTGKRKITTKTFSTRSAAKQWLSSQLVGVDENVPRASTMSLGAHLTSWIEEKKMSSEETNYYSGAVKKIIPVLGGVRLCDLSAAHVTAYLKTLEAGHPRHRHFRTLSGALKAAVRASLLPRSPMDGMPWPKYEPKRHRVWTEEELAAFLDHARGARREHVPFAVWRLLAVTGCRVGEALGVRTLDVSPTSVEFSQQVTRDPRGRVVVKSTLKTKRSHRQVQIDAQTAADLRAWRKSRASAQLAAGEDWVESGLLFTDSLGKALHPSVVSKAFGRLCAAAGVPQVRLHDLRHTNASMLLAAGAPAHVVAQRLGDNVTTILTVYAHVLDSSQDQAAAIAGNLGAQAHSSSASATGKSSASGGVSADGARVVRESTD